MPANGKSGGRDRTGRIAFSYEETGVRLQARTERKHRRQTSGSAGIRLEVPEDMLNQKRYSDEYQPYPESASDPGAPRQYLLEKHDDGQGGHPHEIHHPGYEQQRHQHPAASHAERPVSQAHPDRAGSAFPPRSPKKTERAPAVRETTLFYREPLIDAAGDKQSRAHKRAGSAHIG